MAASCRDNRKKTNKYTSVELLEDKVFKLSLIEVILRTLPEAFICIVGAHIFANIPIKKRAVTEISLGLAAIVFCIRSLPISNGVHTLIGMSVAVVLMRFQLEVPIRQSLKGVLGVISVLVVSESINIILIKEILKKDVQIIFNNPLQKTLYGMPSLMLTIGMIYTYYQWTRHKK